MSSAVTIDFFIKKKTSFTLHFLQLIHFYFESEDVCLSKLIAVIDLTISYTAKITWRPLLEREFAGQIGSTYDGISLEDCKSLCLASASHCRSFNYYPSDSRCVTIANIWGDPGRTILAVNPQVNYYRYCINEGRLPLFLELRRIYHQGDCLSLPEASETVVLIACNAPSAD